MQAASQENVQQQQPPQQPPQQRKLSGKRTGEVLVEHGRPYAGAGELAIVEQRTSRQRIGDIALSKGWCTKAS